MTSFRGADCYSDHNLVSLKLKLKLKTKRKERNERRVKIDTENLNDYTIKSQFQIQLKNRFEVLQMMDEEDEEELSINERWMHIKAVVKEVGEEEIVAECREPAKE